MRMKVRRMFLAESDLTTAVPYHSASSGKRNAGNGHRHRFGGQAISNCTCCRQRVLHFGFCKLYVSLNRQRKIRVGDCNEDERDWAQNRKRNMRYLSVVRSRAPGNGQTLKPRKAERRTRGSRCTRTTQKHRNASYKQDYKVACSFLGCFIAWPNSCLLLIGLLGVAGDSSRTKRQEMIGGGGA